MKANKDSVTYTIGYWLGVALAGIVLGAILFCISKGIEFIITPAHKPVVVVEAIEDVVESAIPEPEAVEVVELVPNPIDYREVMVSALFRYETGNGESDLWVYHNNAGGIKCFTSLDQCTSDGFQRYASKEAGMESLRYHVDLYRDQYGDDLRAIRSVYCYQCGETDVIKFTEIYQEELAKWTQ